MPATLALLDLVPVLLTAAGLGIVARLLFSADQRAGRWAVLGAGLVVGGGLAKAAWKLILAGGGPDLPFLYAALYPGLAVGYLLLAGTAAAGPAHSGRRRWLPALGGLVLLGTLSLVAAGGGGRLVPLAWLVTGGLASMGLDVVLARRARAAGRRDAAALFIVHAVGTIGLQALGRPDDQSVALQWVQESLNAVTQGAFLVAAVMLAAQAAEQVRARTGP